ncbi:DNA topoisomerase 1 [Teleopsis dalmanni]|uniref:DNA topoisomerase 1 n=1 Tax=Teleopsis dalmanni TaxID=139649 RepID=UPI0018CF835D|nr:DNA topoisomerase 1 [Teleopsis dalmanni]
MSVDVALPPSNEDKPRNVENGVQLNGMSNGHHSSKHKSSSKDKHRDKDRDRDHKSSKEHKSSSRDKEKHSSSSSKDKHRDKDRDGKHSSSSSRDKERDKSKSSSGHHKSSSKDKDRKDRDRDRDRDRKESKSSSSSSKDKSSSSNHKSSSSSSRDKDKDRHHKSSSSSKHKHSSSSSSSLKSNSSNNEKPIYDGEFIKPEPLSQTSSNGYDFPMEDVKKQEPSPTEGYDYYDGNQKNGYEEKPNIKTEINFNISQASSCDYSLSQFRDDEPSFVIKKEASYDDDIMMKEEEEDEDDDVPLAMRKSVSTINGIEDDDDDEDIPLAKRKAAPAESDDDDIPLLARKKIKKEPKQAKTKKRQTEVEQPKQKKAKKASATEIKQEVASPVKRGKKVKVEEEEEVWRWWEEEKRADGVKWNTLEHKGPVFAPLYERVPKNVRFFYNGKPMELSEETEEAATFYAKMLNHDYCTKDVFNQNFFKDFRKSMTSHEKDIIKDFNKCNFEEMHKYFAAESEKRKNATKEEKLAKKLENEAIIKEYGICIIDGHKEKIGNFRLEPPGLFRGRGEHPKMGMIKRRIRAEDVSINCGRESKVPAPPKGHRWKEVRNDNTVTWLASWIENVQGQVKYIMLNPSSKLKGEKDHVKYETARRLAQSIDKIRSTYRDEWKSKEMRVRQRAVALYFIDKLALRAGNEKDEDQADTVGCCSLRVEHVQLHKELNGKENVVVFDFLGKDSIRYYNEVEVEKRVFKNLELFMENKKKGDDLFDRLNTQVLNEHLKELMDGLTAKVFRTYNASITLQNQLDLLTDPDATVPEKLLAYNRANRAVAILCNHQRSVPKSHEKSMENLKDKIRVKREALDDCEAEYNDLKKAAKRGSVKEKVMADKKGKQLERLKEQLKKLELQETDRDENKTIALGTSKLNYLDPRISVAWCKKHGVPIEKIFNKTQRNKFMWAIHMADENYRF